jgi:hypothetical protein
MLSFTQEVIYMENMEKTPRAKSNKKATKIVVAVISVVILGFLGIIVFGVLLFLGIMSTLKNSEPYNTAIAHIEESQRVRELVGEIEDYGRFPSGNVHNVNGRGTAEFTIRVNGTEGSTRVFVRLKREPLRDWEIVEFFISGGG